MRKVFFQSRGMEVVNDDMGTGEGIRKEAWKMPTSGNAYFTER